jgi:general secretion pathway protein J
MAYYRDSQSRERGVVSPMTSKQNDQGFALLEIIVAMVIMAIVGLLAWRGMDAMIRGREVIERRSNEDLSYMQLVRQFDRDCQEIVRRDELNTLNTTNNLSVSALPSIAAGAKNIWWLRHYRADTQEAWLLVGYGIGPGGLQRYISQPLFRRSDALALWGGLLREPDLASNDLSVSWQAAQIVRQSFQVQSSIVSGAGSSGVSASGTGTPPASANPATTNSASTNNANTNANANVSVITPDQQGLVMQWWLKDIALPITRSCLMGGAL